VSGLAWAAGETKKVKVLGSPFQQIDFGLRGSTVMAMANGRAWKIPHMVAEQMAATVFPAYRDKLAREWVTNPKLKLIQQQGGSIAGGQSIARNEMGRLGSALTQAPFIGPLANVPIVGNAIKPFNAVTRYMNEGLFDGAYVAVGKHVGIELFDSIKKGHPKWTDVQVAGAAAENMNLLLSSQDAWQSVFRNEQTRNILRGFVLSMGEQEGMLRGFVRMLPSGPEARAMSTPGVAGRTVGNLWSRYWIGYYASMFMLANVMQYAATGEPLNWQQLSPVRLNGEGHPRFNSRFLRPIIGHNDKGEPRPVEPAGHAAAPGG
jgi:hypothetical protein